MKKFFSSIFNAHPQVKNISKDKEDDLIDRLENETYLSNEFRFHEYSGELYSKEHNCKFTVERVTAQISPDPTDKRKLQLNIDKILFKEWCKERFEKLCQFLPRERRQSKGLKR